MLSKGLLVEDQDGQEYLLSVNEQIQGGPPHEVRISRRVAGQWVLVEMTEPPLPSVREGGIGALWDFFAGICRMLYQQNDGRQRLQRVRPAARPPGRPVACVAVMNRTMRRTDRRAVAGKGACGVSSRVRRRSESFLVRRTGNGDESLDKS